MSESRLRIHTSNRLEVLVEHLAHDLGSDPLPPFETEVLIVQSQGMDRWLTLELARRWGIAASLSTPFPKVFFHHLADAVENGRPWPATGGRPVGGGGRPPMSPFSREILVWRIFQLLGDGEIAEDRRWAESLAAYLDGDPDQRKRYPLAARLAALFDDYQIYRPDLLLEWEAAPPPGPARGDDPRAWQAMLWRRLLAGAGEEGPARRFRSLIEKLHGPVGDVPAAGLPRRLSVFGIATLPPVFLRLLAALGRSLPVTVYFVSPTYHFWGDLRSRREADRLQARWRRTAGRSGETPAPDAAEPLHFEEGHPLLAAFGRQGRDFFNLLQDVDEAGECWHELDFVAPPADSLLHVLQADVLHLVDRAGGGDHEPFTADPGDDSLTVHVCHSPMREMEVLRDRIFDALRRDAALHPSEILVLVPDVAAYGPYVEAVFGVDSPDLPRLPFSIADRRAGDERPTADTVLQVLDLVAGRLDAGSVFDLLEIAAIRRAAGIAGHEVPRLRQWIEDTRVRWGMDGRQRGEDFGLPPEDANTWRAGLDRLLMGYAAGAGDELVAGVLPFGGATADGGDLLGRLAGFVTALFDALRALRRPRPLGDWAAAIERVIEALYKPETEDEEHGLSLVRRVIDELRDAHDRASPRRAEPHHLVRLEVVRTHLRARLADDTFGRGFLSGGITFCALKPMRTLPFKVICVAGLHDGAFPRRDPPRSFDLIAAHPRPGDRSLRDDDRYLFLETLLAARERLILTYVGRSQRDSNELAPSVVVSELLDHLDRACTVRDGRRARELVVVEHRLQPWSPAYFDAAEPRLESYSREDLAGSLALAAGPCPPAPFVTGRSPAGGEKLDLGLRDLAELWVNPSRAYCQRVLELYLVDDRRSGDDAEPFTVDSLAGYGIRSWLLAEHLRAAGGRALDDRRLAVLRARGDLPLAGLGAAAFAELDRAVRSFAATLPEHRPLEPPAIELEGAGWRLSGPLGGLSDRGLLRFRPARVKPKDLIRAWVEHVAWNAWQRTQPRRRRSPARTLVYGTDKSVRFPPLDEARFYLEALIAGYRKGLERPLPLFEQASFRFADQRRRLADPRSRRRLPPLERAREGWQGGEFLRGDREDPYVALCFRDQDPLAGDSFATWADYLWGPIFDGMEEL